MGAGRRFSLKRQLGEGSFGTVYLADMLSLGGFQTRVALKILNHRWPAESDAGRRLRDEARLLGRLEHRNIVRVYDLVRLDGRWAVVMEAVRGADLEQVIGASNHVADPAPLRAALQLVGDVAAALRAALLGEHGDEGKLSVVHRDIKPSNLLLTPEGDVKVLDFGIAGADLDDREASTSNVGFGSIPYMSPERLRGDPATAAGDVYSLGAVLYELLVGSPYGRTELAEDRAVEQQAQRRQLLDQAMGEAGVGPDCAALVMEMMAFEPEARPDICEVRERITALVARAVDEDLATWAGRVVPRTLELTGGGTPTSAVLSEEESGSVLAQPALPAVPAAQKVSSSPTLVADGLEPAAPASDPPASEPPPRRRGAPALLLVAAAALAAGVWVLVTADDPAPPAGRIQVTAPAPTEPVALASVLPQAATPAPPAPPAPVEAPPPQLEAAKGADSEPDPPVAAAPRGSGETRAARTAEPEPSPPSPPEAAAPVPTARMVKVVVPGATTVEASCGGRTGAGTTSLVVRDAPHGACTVRAEVDGRALSGSLAVSAPAAFTCAPSEGGLSCR